MRHRPVTKEHCRALQGRVARRGLASGVGDIAPSPVRASIVSRVPAAQEKAMQAAALISILTGKYILQAMPIVHYRQESPSRFVRLISGAATTTARARRPRARSAVHQGLRCQHPGVEEGEARKVEECNRGPAGSEAGSETPTSLRRLTRSSAWSGPPETRNWEERLGPLGPSSGSSGISSGTANCGAMVMAASISRFQGPGLPACWAGCELSNRVS